VDSSLLERNKCIIMLGQYSVNKPDHFLHNVLPHFAPEGKWYDKHELDYSPQARQQRYEASLTPEGLEHELSLPNPVETPWGVIRERDGLDIDTLTRIREYDTRKTEWDLQATPEDVALVSGIIQATHRIIHENQADYRAIPPGPNRNDAVLALCKAHHEQASEQVLANGL
jgi:hypothetical protein